MDPFLRPGSLPDQPPPGPDGIPTFRARPRAPPWSIPPAQRGLLAAGVLVLLAGLAVGAWTQTDLDRDGLKVTAEWAAGTSVRHADSDGDGLSDGWEVERGLDPRSVDTDGDSLDDRFEATHGLDPRQADSDGDGLRDPDELNNALHPLVPDLDGDGLLDGAELAAGTDALNQDTDGDGLRDDVENGTEFSPLDPDSFDVGLSDAISWTFKEQGQPPGRDADQDGIPDGWESASGLVDWGVFRPRPGQRDLLVEFVRVLGPDSSRYAFLNFTPSYEQVEATFRNESGIEVQWVETVVTLPAEPRPALLPSVFESHYASVLGKSRYAQNAFVTTVVMNPQHDQSQILHLGVAPIRGMLAAVDYGTHVTVTFQGSYLAYDAGCDCNVSTPYTLPIYPALESVVLGNRQDVLAAAGWDAAGVTAAGEISLRDGDHTFYWRPNWFATAPRLVFDSGQVSQSTRTDVDVKETELAFTILHELGHTLGLCHLDLAECFAGIASTDQAIVRQSTMHPQSGGALHFLASEWGHVATYLTCPPEEPLRLVADGATPAQVLDSKYGYTFNNALNAERRRCADFPVVEARTSLSAYATPTPLTLAETANPEVPVNSSARTMGYALFSGLVAMGEAGLALFLTRPRSIPVRTSPRRRRSFP